MAWIDGGLCSAIDAIEPETEKNFFSYEKHSKVLTQINRQDVFNFLHEA